VFCVLPASKLYEHIEPIRLSVFLFFPLLQQSPQGSDQRGQATTYALPITAAALVAFALTVRATRSDTKKNAINVGVNTDGADKLQSSSKARGIETAKANAEGLN
jgi:hypothetical protein